MRDQGGGIHATAKKEICTAEYVSTGAGGITREKRERMYHGYDDDDDESRFLIVKHSGPLCMYCRRRRERDERERGETETRANYGEEERTNERTNERV